MLTIGLHELKINSNMEIMEILTFDVLIMK